jgi:hypothetical protein
MAFANNNSFNNSNQSGEKKKTNFKIGKLWGSDGILDVSVWVSDTGVKTILAIKAAVGKDPSTGANVFEQKMPNELPRFFMNMDFVRALISAIDATPDPGSININLAKIGGSDKLTIVGQGNSIKMTIDTQKLGSRTITFDSIACGNKNVHATFETFVEFLKIAYKKALLNKLDPEEFGMVVGGEETDELPI